MTFCQELEEIAGILLSNLKRASELVASFKQVAVDRSSDSFRQFNIADYIRDIICSLQPKFVNSQRQVEYICQDKSLMVYTSPGALAQIITNVVDNALEHTFIGTMGGKIQITVTQKVKDIIIEVSDDGVGMNEEIVEHIYDPFYTTARCRGGSGLGMHLVYNLVTQQLKGNIKCESHVGKGSLFHIVFPSDISKYLSCDDNEFEPNPLNSKI